ncbi:Enhancer of polycomb-like protein 1 [Coemansia sp. IMI 209127]|nr:Enhancer of polycomb-like protein 1 [Coemansia sp. IMI 209127]
MVNAQRFRARKVDLKRPLPVFRAADLDDLDEDDNRQVDAIETGVEKDEETEHHLQAAISATHAAASGNAPAKQVYIPTPDASKTIDGYDALYPTSFTCPTSLIRSSETVEECCAPMYCLDDADLEWLRKFNKKRKSDELDELTENEFEVAMDQLETLTRDMVFLQAEGIPTADDLASHAADRDQLFAHSIISHVYEHWKQRRIEGAFKTVMATLQYEDTSKAAEIDPYVCFRRREVRQGRKTRRADQRSLEQLRRLRVNLAMASQVLEMCMDREGVKAQVVDEAQELARQRATVLRMRRRLGVAANVSADDLFVPPVQQRKRMSARDQSQQRARGGVRKPRIATGLASAAAAAAAAAQAAGGVYGLGSGGAHGMLGSGGYADPVIPLPFVLPQTVTVHQYPVPLWQQEMAERIRAKAQIHEAKLGSGFVDATYAGSQNRLHTNSAIDPRMASFWAPSMAQQQTTATDLILQQQQQQQQSLVAFRVRCGRNGRMFMDRRAVRADSQPSSRLQQYRLGLLRPEDHVRLAQIHKRFDTVAASPSLASIPADLLKPFSFAPELLLGPPSPPYGGDAQQVSKLTIPSQHTEGISGQQLVGNGEGLLSPNTLEMMLPRNGGSMQQIASPPLSASSVSLTDDLSATVPRRLLSAGKPSLPHTPAADASSSSNNTTLSAQSSPMLTTVIANGSLLSKDDMLHSLHRSNSADPSAVPNNMHASPMAMAMPINMPSLSSMSPQMGNHHGSPAIAASSTAAKCN